jgi:hypothetical protein
MNPEPKPGESIALTLRVIHSRKLDDVIALVQDEESRSWLKQLGVEGGRIYSRGELRVVQEQHLNAEELEVVHNAKKMFDGTIQLKLL